jgi:membrane-associated phospholipid phosphatase
MNREFKVSFFKYAVVLSLQALTYKLTGFINLFPFQSARSLELPLSVDHLVPFMPAFVWGYSLYYLLLMAGFLLTREKKNFDLFFKEFITITLFADLMFVLVPVIIPVVDLSTVQRTITTDLFQFILSIDTRSNCFPSLHCAHSFLISYRLSKSQSIPPFFKYLFITMALIVACSTLFVKQHWFVDIIGAVMLFIFTLRFYDEKFKHQSV